MSIESTFDQSMTVQAATETPGSMGGTVRTWADAATGIPCRIRLLTASERAMHGSRGLDCTHRIYCSVREITEEQRVVVGGVVYKILVVNNPHRLGHHLEIDVQEQRG
jgi:head-tail adaptor